MKEALYKLPLIDAFKAQDECPFCQIQRNLEHSTLDFVLGSQASYMESDIREATDKAGFCASHLKQMYDYGNSLGNGLILKTHYKSLIAEMKQVLSSYTPAKASLKEKLPIGPKAYSFDAPADPIAIWTRKKDLSCYACNYYKDSYSRYFDTFFYLYKKEADFIDLIKASKGFCLHHFGQIMEAARTALSEKEQKNLSQLLFPLMEENMDRVFEDVSWFCDKFDYRYKDADWKNSKDAVPRAMQKLRGIYPQDPPYKRDK